tara:strand:+ start:1118 stop:1756 length:639 start_codon:yes stop_codon:yes gene_type:complete
MNHNFLFSNYYIHFARGNIRDNSNTLVKKFRKNKKTILNNNYDKLFFNFLLLVKMDELELDYNKNNEIKFKYNFAQKIENIKIKKIENIINNLCYEDNINLKTLSALCCYFSKSMCYFSENIFVTLNVPQESTEQVYLVKNDLSIVCVKKEIIKELREKSFEIQDLNKPFYSMSHYKLDELKNIASIIGIDSEGKKKVIYEKITQHLGNAIF